MYAAYERTYVPGSKTAVFYHQDLYNIIKNNLNRTEPPQLLKDRYMLESRALLFAAHHFFFDIFNRKLQQYVEGDFINYNNRRWVEEYNPKKFKENKTPFAVLTLKELEAGFVVSLAPLALSILVFGLEWMQILKDLIAFLFIFKTLFKVKMLEQTNHSHNMRLKIAAWQKLLRNRKIMPNVLSTNLSSNDDQPKMKNSSKAEKMSATSKAWSDDLEAWFADCQTK